MKVSLFVFKRSNRVFFLSVVLCLLENVLYCKENEETVKKLCVLKITES